MIFDRDSVEAGKPCTVKLALLEPHPRFGDKLYLEFLSVCPQNGTTAVLKGLKKGVWPNAPDYNLLYLRIDSGLWRESKRKLRQIKRLLPCRVSGDSE